MIKMQKQKLLWVILVLYLNFFSFRDLYSLGFGFHIGEISPSVFYDIFLESKADKKRNNLQKLRSIAQKENNIK